MARNSDGRGPHHPGAHPGLPPGMQPPPEAQAMAQHMVALMQLPPEVRHFWTHNMSVVPANDGTPDKLLIVKVPGIPPVHFAFHVNPLSIIPILEALTSGETGEDGRILSPEEAEAQAEAQEEQEAAWVAPAEAEHAAEVEEHEAALRAAESEEE